LRKEEKGEGVEKGDKRGVVQGGRGGGRERRGDEGSKRARGSKR